MLHLHFCIAIVASANVLYRSIGTHTIRAIEHY